MTSDADKGGGEHATAISDAAYAAVFEVVARFEKQGEEVEPTAAYMGLTLALLRIISKFEGGFPPPGRAVGLIYKFGEHVRRVFDIAEAENARRN